MSEKDYYCSLKFTELAIDLEKRAVNSCCSATPARINFVDMKQNGLINVSYLQNDRQDMLNNIPVTSCYNSCWSVENKGQLSKRLIDQVTDRTHLSPVVNKIQHLIITTGSRCNLTCVYCNKNYSRAWSLDIVDNGDYQIDIGQDTYIQTKKDKALSKLSQTELYSGSNYNNLVNQLTTLTNHVNKVDIVGGEPFLYNSLINLISSFPSTVEVLVLTGAGIKPKKFQEKINLIKDFKNVIIGISAESVGEYYEFIRYGNTFQNFLEIVNIVKRSGLKYKFISTLSNLTIFGYLDFVKFAETDIRQNFCSDPGFLRISVLDDLSKNKLAEQFDKENNKMFDGIVHHLRQSTQDSNIDNDKNNLAIFIKEFTCRRYNLNLDIFPASFLKWLNLNVVQ